MSGIRTLLSHIFSREVQRPEPLDLTDPLRLEKYLRNTQDAQVADMILQQAGRAPFWPQSRDMHDRFDLWREDSALGPLLRQAAAISLGARRHLLAALNATPDPAFDTFLPQTEETRLIIAFTDQDEPDQLHFAWRLTGAAPESWPQDALNTEIPFSSPATFQPLFTCRDEDDLIQRGWGLRRRRIYRALLLTGDDARRLLAHGQGDAPLVITPARALAEPQARHHPADAFAALVVFARLSAATDGNRALRQTWQQWEDTGLTSLIGTRLGLSLGDLQDSFEVMTRQDLPADAQIFARIPRAATEAGFNQVGLCRLQDRMMTTPLTSAAAPEYDSA